MRVITSKPAMRRIDSRALRKLAKHDFERFCRKLLDAEVSRFPASDPPPVELEGPGLDDTADGGRDLRARIEQRAHEEGHWNLLSSTPADIWFSCKSHKDDGPTTKAEPRSWMAQVRADLDPSPRIGQAYRSELVEDAPRIAREKLVAGKHPPKRLLEHLRDGGCFHVLVNVGASQRAEFEAEIAAILGFWIEVLWGSRVALHDRIKIRDAHHLANVLEARPVRLDSDLEAALGLGEPEILLRWPEWTLRLTKERPPLDVFGMDDRRRALVEQLRRFLTAPDSHEKVLHLWGPPGVGKTHLVHHVIAELPELHARVRFTQRVSDIGRFLQQREPRLADDVVLVVDEAPTAGLGNVLLGPFEAATLDSSRARLIVIGPRDGRYRGRPDPRAVEPLADAAIREILMSEMAGNDERLETVLELCEGYPLFAFWLGKALADDPYLLREPRARLTGDRCPWEATAAVLVGPRGDDASAWEQRAVALAKALLLSVLAHAEAWASIDDTEQEALAKALRTSWDALLESAHDCERRGLLRSLDDGRRYISPANLERMILNYFFDGRGPVDPADIARRCPRRYTRLQERAHRVEASDACKRSLASAHLDALESLLTNPSTMVEELRIAPLRWSSHDAPERTALTIESLVAASDAMSESDLVWALVHLSVRRLSASAFAAVEASLFRIGTEGIAHHRHVALQTWARLFACRAHFTHRPFEERLALLRHRLRSSSPGERKAAIAGLGPAIGSSTTTSITPGWDDEDRPWEHQGGPSLDLDQRSERAWSMLLDISNDADPDVAAAARSLVASGLRLGLAGGLTVGALEQLTGLVKSWAAHERRLVAAQLAEIDHGMLARSRGDAIVEPLRRLRESVAPTGLFEHLVAHVGHRALARRSEPAELHTAADVAIAEALVARPPELRACIGWLASGEAIRWRELARTIGRCDPEQTLLPLILEIVEQSPSSVLGRGLVAIYLTGWGETLGADGFDAWIEQDATGRGVSALLRARAIVTSGGSDRRAAMLLRLIAHEALPPDALEGLGYDESWGGAVALELVDELLLALARCGDPGAREAVGLSAMRLARSTSCDARVRWALHDILTRTGERRIPAIEAIAWRRAVLRLAASGDWHPIKGLLAKIASGGSSEYPHHLDDVLGRLVQQGFSSRIWSILSEILVAHAPTDSLVLLVEQVDLFHVLDPEVVMKWIGMDAGRAIRVAEVLTPRAPRLEPVARELIGKLGADHDAAMILGRHACAPHGFYGTDDALAARAKLARQWSLDDDPEVRRWAAAVVERLELMDRRDQARRRRA